MSATENHRAQPRATTGQRLLRLPEVRARLACSRSTVDRLIEAGELPVVRIRTRRYVADVDLEDFINRHREVAAA